MAIEDGNRPEFIRTIERMAAHFHLANTTGIMPQTSDTPLSDRDSVKLAIPYIERMWDQFLVEFGRSAEGAGGDALRIFMDYYTYDYWTLSRAIRNLCLSACPSPPASTCPGTSSRSILCARVAHENAIKQTSFY